MSAGRGVERPLDNLGKQSGPGAGSYQAVNMEKSGVVVRKSIAEEPQETKKLTCRYVLGRTAFEWGWGT